MAKIQNISGFPEWLPEQRRLEVSLIDRIRTIFESYGFTPIETPAVELVRTLQAKGVVDKELFAVKRLASHDDAEIELALHFDLTVPFARYVAQHLSALTFPFKRYQVQKVWRGDRPQKGRFREFYQLDIDIVARDTLPIACDAEVIIAFCRALQAFEIGPFVLRVNNKKIVLGILERLEIPSTQWQASVTAIDKFDKIGEAGVLDELSSFVGLSRSIAARLIKDAIFSCRVSELASLETRLESSNALFRQGVQELREVIELVPPDLQPSIEVHTNLVRGLDYYTGLILEAHLPQYPEFGSVGGGGRYDDLVSEYLNKKVPGVGASIGLTRLMDLIFSEALVPLPSPSPSRVLITLYSEEQLVSAFAYAEELRAHALPTEVYPRPIKLGKQIEYAARKGIPFVVFLNPESAQIEVKDITTGEQRPVSGVDELVALVLDDKHSL